MKAVMFSNPGNEFNLNRVYRPRAMERLRGLVELYPEIIHNGNLEEHAKAVAEAEVAFCTWGMPVFTEEEIEKYMPNLKAVFYAAGSVQYFARPFLEKGIRVFSAQRANNASVVQWAVAQIMLATKGFFQSLSRTREDYREAARVAGKLPGNFDCTVSILGAGVIGTGVIEGIQKMMYAPGEINIKVFDPFMSEERAQKLGVKKVGLEEAFEADVVSNHLANKEEIRGILHYGLFSRMPETGVFINTGRGAQVVEADLVRALREVPTRAAVLDVTDPEPPIPGSDMTRLPNLFLTPHSAGSNGNECERMAHYMMDAMLRMDEKDQVCEVTLAQLATLA